MYDHLAATLERLYGLGGSPEKRHRFFKQLQQTCDTFGEGAFRVVKTVSSEATSKNQPGNWFCAAVMRRLREAGYVPMDSRLDAPKKGATR